MAAGSPIHDLIQGCPGANPLAAHYRDFEVSTRVLLTGHSHQAWPDCAKQGLLAAYQDAARHADDKWDKALKIAERVKQGYAQRLDDPQGAYVLGQNVHTLMVRLCSALAAYSTPKALGKRAPMLTSNEEFHSLRRQLDRWSEYGIPIERVPHNASVVDTMTERLLAHPKAHYGALVLSAVSFRSGLWVPKLATLAKVARETHTPLILDAYHAVNAIPFSLTNLDLQDAFVLGGGYKYCQLGEGVCFLRIPAQMQARPAITGWFAEFELRDAPNLEQVPVKYTKGPGAFAGSTYDPISHYRAAAVFDFFDTMGLDPVTLRAINQRQVSRLIAQIEALNLDPQMLCLLDEVSLNARAGFLALRTPHASALCAPMRKQGVWVDARANVLRLGPAPYLSDAQLTRSVEVLDACLRTL